MGVKLQPSSAATAAAVYALVYQSAGANMADSAFTLIPYDTVVQQSAGFAFDTGAGHAFTCPRAGVLSITATEQIASAAYSELVLSVFKGGVEVHRGPQVALTIKAIWLASSIPVAKNDVIDIRLFQTSGGVRSAGAGIGGAHAEFILN